MACTQLEAADAPTPLTLSSTQQTAVARAFAPVLVFHPLEQYFPISPMLRLGTEPVSGDQPAAPEGLEGWPTRVAGYRALSGPEKLQRGALGYRVFSRID